MNPKVKKSADIPSTRLTCGFIFLVTFAVFSGALDNNFVMWDDSAFIYENPFITSLSLENLWTMATTFHYSNWQPLSWLSHAIDYQIFGLHPAGHHLTSVLFHCWNTFWVFLIVREYLSFACKENIDSRILWQSALIAALFFGLHPLRVESVAWVSERKDVLSAFLSFPVFLTYLRYVTAQEAKEKSFWMRTSLLLFFLSLTAKPMPLMLPIILLLLDYYPFARWKTTVDLIPLIREKIPFFALSLGSAIVTIYAQKQIGAMVPLEVLDLSRRIANAVRSLCFIYLEKSLWPMNLVPVYFFPEASKTPWDIAWAPGIIFLIITWLCYKAWKKKKPLYAIAWLYFIITLIPVIGIVQVGQQAAADRYSYFPSLSLSFLLGAGLYATRRFTFMSSKITLEKTAFFSMGAGLVLLSCLTFKQVKVWEESISFWTQIGQNYPKQGAWTYVKRGNALLVRGQVDEAIEQLKAGFNLVEGGDRLPLHFNLGTAYTYKEMYTLAEEEYLKALTISKGFAPGYNALGKLYFLMGKMDLAEENLKKSITLSKKFPLAHINLGELYIAQNRLQLAEDELQIALEQKPTSPNAYDNLGIIYFKRKDYSKAEEYFLKSIDNEKNYFPAFKHLGELYKETGEIEKAETAFRQALEILPDYNNVQTQLDALRNKEISAEHKAN